MPADPIGRSGQQVGSSTGQCCLAAGSAGLDRDSAINVSQVVTLDKRDLIERMGNVDGSKMEHVEAGL
jgi:mRNA-degrading endonuclease toxin of MazEF toxin-antitoxin module